MYVNSKTNTVVSEVKKASKITTNLIWAACVDADRARKHGLDEFVLANPCKFTHSDFFKMLQTLTLDYRLNDAYTCLVGTNPFCVLIQGRR